MGYVIDKDNGYAAVLAALAKKPKVTLGIHSGASKGYPNGTTVLDVAGWNHDGTERIPPRPFLDNWIAKAKESGKIMQQIVAGMKPVLQGKMDVKTALDRLGLVWVGEIQQGIADRVPPPNAPSTIKKKGSDVPLIDTGQLRSAITHKVTGA